jgi:hypothetical protein
MELGDPREAAAKDNFVLLVLDVSSLDYVNLTANTRCVGGRVGFRGVTEWKRATETRKKDHGSINPEAGGLFVRLVGRTDGHTRPLAARKWCVGSGR